MMPPQSKLMTCQSAGGFHAFSRACPTPARPRNPPVSNVLHDLADVHLQLSDVVTSLPLPPYTTNPPPLFPGVIVVWVAAAAVGISMAAANDKLTRARHGTCVSGWSRRDLVEVQPSGVHGRGVVAREDIAAATVVGAYPGVLRSATDVLNKAHRAPACRNFIFCIDADHYLDPTDAHGQVSLFPGPNPAWPNSIDPTMTFVNEPPLHSTGPNLSVTSGPGVGDMLFIASRDISRGEELFVDYGSSYDRSSYSNGRGA